MAFIKKIAGNKHPIVSRFIPFLNNLDGEFGEENVYIGPFDRIKGDCQGIRVRLKYFDPVRLSFRLQAKKGDAVQYFFLRLSEDQQPYIERFLTKYGHL
jgi:hypothetical protein